MAQKAFALLNLLVNRDDRVALRWLVGLGGNNWNSAGYRRIRAYCEQTGLSPWDLLDQISQGAVALAHTGPIVARFNVIKLELAALEGKANLVDLVDHLLPDGNAGLAALRALTLRVLPEAEEDVAKLLKILSQAISQPDIPSEIEDVRIMSLHKSKGLSAPVTIIAGCVEGLLPKQPAQDVAPAVAAAELEEQRRLFFVGISRVKADPTRGKPGTLILTYSQRMSLADAMGAGIAPAFVQYGTAHLQASRFIRELGPRAPQPEAG